MIRYKFPRSRGLKLLSYKDRGIILPIYYFKESKMDRVVEAGSSFEFYVGLITVLLVFFVFNLLIARREIKIYQSKFDLIGVCAILPLVAMVFLMLYLHITKNVDGLVLIVLILFVLYVGYGLRVIWKNNDGFFNCLIAFIIRMNILCSFPLQLLLWVILLGGTYYVNGVRLTKDNIRNYGILTQLRFAVFNIFYL